MKLCANELALYHTPTLLVVHLVYTHLGVSICCHSLHLYHVLLMPYLHRSGLDIQLLVDDIHFVSHAVQIQSVYCPVAPAYEHFLMAFTEPTKNSQGLLATCELGRGIVLVEYLQPVIAQHHITVCAHAILAHTYCHISIILTHTDTANFQGPSLCDVVKK